MKDHQRPPRTMREFRQRVMAMGLTIEPGTRCSTHLRIVRGDGQVIARVAHSPSRESTIVNEFKRLQKRAAQVAGGRWIS